MSPEDDSVYQGKICHKDVQKYEQYDLYIKLQNN